MVTERHFVGLKFLHTLLKIIVDKSFLFCVLNNCQNMQHIVVDCGITCVSYAEARLSYRLDVCPSVRHTLVLYQNGLTYCHAFFATR